MTTYLEATEKESRFRQAADEAARERAWALAEMHRSGMSYGKIAEVTGLSRARVQQLVERDRAHNYVLEESERQPAGGAVKVR